MTARSSGDEVTVESVESESSLENPLDPAEYPVTLYDDGEVADVATLLVEEATGATADSTPTDTPASPDDGQGLALGPWAAAAGAVLAVVLAGAGYLLVRD